MINEEANINTNTSNKFCSEVEIKNKDIAEEESLIEKNLPMYTFKTKRSPHPTLNFVEEDDALSVHSWESCEESDIESNEEEEDSMDFGYDADPQYSPERCKIKQSAKFLNFEERQQEYLNKHIYDVEISDNEFLKVILGQLQKIEGDISYAMFRSKFLPKHRKANFTDYLRFRRLETKVLH